MTDSDVTPMLNELVDRSRRIETRLTKYLESIGFDTKVQRAYWNGHSVIIPTPNTPLSEVLAQVPQDYPDDEPIPVRCRGQFIMEFFRTDLEDGAN